MNLLDRVQHLIKEGRSVLDTEQAPRRGVVVPNFVDEPDFRAWRARCIGLLKAGGPSVSTHASEFDQVTNQGAYASEVEAGLGVLRGCLSELQDGAFVHPTTKESPTDKLLNIADRFHTVARQLRQRHAGRPTLEIKDEYDCQDLLHALLRLHFDDIRPEEWTPSYAGSSSRMDFLLKDEQTVIEVKMARTGLGDKEVGDQLIIDTCRYETHQDCKRLICFVYDPDGLLRNPRGLESDLRRTDGPLPVDVWIRPSGK